MLQIHGDARKLLYVKHSQEFVTQYDKAGLACIYNVTKSVKQVLSAHPTRQLHTFNGS